MEWLLAFALVIAAWWLLAAAADTRRGERLAHLAVHTARTAPARLTSWAWSTWSRARIRL
ncbi:hypothetical protein [Streptomyces sp. NPDC005760]|uniref:hypothetical protein n=1 Tax=Streptomyces sp. NPDC005760 TaxID=3156718 RepID=UPI003401E49E